MGTSAIDTDHRDDLVRRMGLARACDQAGLRTTARALADYGMTPYRLGESAVRAIEFQLRWHLRKEPAADLERAAALLLLLSLKKFSGSRVRHE